MKNILLTLSATLLSSCTSQMVNYPGKSGSAFAPTNEVARPGMIKYLNQGADSVIKARRNDAYRQMSVACAGPYKIINESPSLEGGTVVQTGMIATFSQSQFWYIMFQCESESVPQAAQR